MIQDIEKDFIQMLSKMTGFDPAEIKPDMHIAKDLGVDSLKIIEIAAALEQKYKVTIKESQMTKLHTVKDAVGLVRELVGGAEI